MTQQDDITQRVLTDDEIREVIFNAIGFGFDPGELQSVNADDLIKIAHDLLSKVPAPIADSTLRLEQALHELIDKIVPGLDTGDLVQDARRASTALSATLASAPVADERFKPPFDNCSFRMCDLPGQCRGEGKCHHPASAPVAGEAQGWSGWACQYPNKLPRLYGSKEIAQLNCDAASGDRVLFLSEHAAPQASAEDVRNAALEKAAALVGGHTWAGASQIVSDLIAEHIRALKTQADKDGGQLRAGDVSAEAHRAALLEVERVGIELAGRLHEAAMSLETISQIAGRPGKDMETMDDVRGYAHSRARAARAALSAPQAEQGERDA